MADRTPIVVAAIGLIGVISAAAIANPKNVRELFGRSEAKPATGSAPADSAKIMPATPPAGSLATVTGPWIGDDRIVFVFTQNGAHFSYRQPDTIVDEGSGTIAGDTLRYAFTTPQGSGTCEATFDAAAQTIVGTCTRGGERWPVSLRRARPKELHRDF